MNTLLKTLMEEFREALKEPIHPREVTLQEVAKKAFVAVGMRRTGKTYLLYLKAKKILQEIAFEQLLYLNFEDDRLAPLDQKKAADLIESFYTLYPENHDRLCHLFLDEIQLVEGWPVLIRRLLDTKKLRIFLSGSSSKLLSKEIASALRGRSLAVEVWPYSFLEAMQFKKLPLPQRPFGKKAADQLRKYLKGYLTQGGFPEIQNLEREAQIRILQDYVHVVVFRDIVERHEITNTALIRHLIHTLIRTAGRPFSVHKTFNDFKSQGFRLSKNTLYEYLGYIEDAYLSFLVPLFSPSLRKSYANPKKAYAIDPGLIHSQHLFLEENWGPLFENLIYIDLRRKKYAVHYYLTQERKEVDFLAKDIHGRFKLLQVCWDMDKKEVMERETRALHDAEKELGVKGKIITPENYLDFLEEN